MNTKQLIKRFILKSHILADVYSEVSRIKFKRQYIGFLVVKATCLCQETSNTKQRARTLKLLVMAQKPADLSFLDNCTSSRLCNKRGM